MSDKFKFSMYGSVITAEEDGCCLISEGKELSHVDLEFHFQDETSEKATIDTCVGMLLDNSSIGTKKGLPWDFRTRGPHVLMISGASHHIHSIGHGDGIETYLGGLRKAVSEL